METLKRNLRGLLRRCHVMKGEVVLNPGCDHLEVDNWEVSDFVVGNLVPIVGVRPFPLNELCLMVAAVAALKPTHIFEWGTHVGKSARIFYESARRFGVPSAIYSVDLPEGADHVEHPGRRHGSFVKGCPGVTLLRGDGLETSLRLCRELQGEERFRPLFFVDGDHEYASVKRELEGIIEAAPRANILLHDTFFQSSGAHYNTGPHRAIRDVVNASHGFKVIAQELGLPGMTLLYRKQADAGER